MVTKDQIIAKVWRLFDLQPRPLPEAARMSMDMYAEEMSISFYSWVNDNGYSGSPHDLYRLYLERCNQSNPK